MSVFTTTITGGKNIPRNTRRRIQRKRSGINESVDDIPREDVKLCHGIQNSAITTRTSRRFNENRGGDKSH
jgi:hypothetical protein